MKMLRKRAKRLNLRLVHPGYLLVKWRKYRVRRREITLYTPYTSISVPPGSHQLSP